MVGTRVAIALSMVMGILRVLNSKILFTSLFCILCTFLSVAQAQNTNFEKQQNCFESLTHDDQLFLESLSKKLIKSCNVNPKIDEVECQIQSKKTMHSEVEKYELKYGRAAKERILIALSAQVEKQQLVSILKIFQDPQIEPSFKRFAQAVLRYQKSLSSVTFEDIHFYEGVDEQNTAWRWMQQRAAMLLDLLETISNVEAETRFEENRRAAEELLFSGIELTKKIKHLKISNVEKEKLIEQVTVLNTLMKDKYNVTKDRFADEAKLATVATGGLVSAALVVVSTGSLAPAFLSAISGGDLVASIGGSVLTGVTSGAGISGVIRISDMIFKARAAAVDKTSNFVCELARRVDSDGEAALEHIWSATWQGGLLGGTLGGSIGWVAIKNQKIAAELGLGGVVLGSGVVVVNTKINLDKIDSIDEKLLEIRELNAKGKATDGEVADAEAFAHEQRAEVYALFLGDLTRLGRYSAGSYRAADRLKQAIANSEKISQIRLSLGRKLSSAEKRAVIDVNEAAAGLKDKVEINRYQTLNKAGFSREEIRKIFDMKLFKTDHNS